MYGPVLDKDGLRMAAAGFYCEVKGWTLVVVMATLAKRKPTKASILVFSSISK
jgi:hypothetical protein